MNNNSEAGIVKLCDFGLCATVHEGCMLNDFVGSPGFFAPELMMRRQYDGACADMWSIGAVSERGAQRDRQSCGQSKWGLFFFQREGERERGVARALSLSLLS